MDLAEWKERLSGPDFLFFFGVLLAVMAVMRLTRMRTTKREPEFKRLVSRDEMLAQLRPPVEPEMPAPAPTKSGAPAIPSASAEEFVRRLENRVRTLEDLVRAADRKIVELNALLQVPGNHRREAPASVPLDRSALPTLAHHQAESLSRARELSRPSRPAESRDGGRLNARYQAVYRLLDQGESAATVAQKLGYPIGEVELIAGLRG